MFVRQYFVTNSSSTSFMAYGIKLPTNSPCDDEGEPYPDEYGDDMNWEDRYETLSGLEWTDAKVGFNSAYHCDDAVMFVNDSYHDIEYGYLRLNNKVGDNWDDIILTACKVLGIDPSEPHWFGWHTGMDG